MAVSINDAVKTLELVVRDYHAAVLVDGEIPLHGATYKVEYQLERLAYLLRAHWRVATRAAPREFVCEIPTTWVQHLRKRLGWKYKADRIYHTPVEAFPSLGLPSLEASTIRLAHLNLDTDYAEEA